MSGLPLYYAMIHRDGQLIEISQPYEAPSIAERVAIRAELERRYGLRAIITFERVGAS